LGGLNMVGFIRLLQDQFYTTSSWDGLFEVELPSFNIPARVDVVVCTYNSEAYFERCLDSIVANVPVAKLYVIDNFSTDDTVKIAKSFGAEVIETRLSLAEARRFSFSLVQTPVFVNIDSDVVLCKNWYSKLMRFWGNDVGCVCGITVDQHPLQRAYLQSMWKLRRPESYDIAHLPNMIARKDALADLEFPVWITKGSVANEDYSIKECIQKKGLKVVNVPVFVKHFTCPPLIDRKTFWYGASGRVSHYVSFKSILLRFALSFPQAIYAGFSSGDARVIPYWVKFRFQVLYGFLNYNRYFNMERKA
jgi:glycosyltransferase involved in cell wall biosynthesis